jgi:hypothetical protein
MPDVIEEAQVNWAVYSTKRFGKFRNHQSFWGFDRLDIPEGPEYLDVDLDRFGHLLKRLDRYVGIRAAPDVLEMAPEKAVVWGVR